jgi:hypothetical protein
MFPPKCTGIARPAAQVRALFAALTEPPFASRSLARAARRFPPPWSIEAPPFIVRDGRARPAIGRIAAHARRGIPYRGGNSQVAKRAAANIEGHSEAAELG